MYGLCWLVDIVYMRLANCLISVWDSSWLVEIVYEYNRLVGIVCMILADWLILFMNLVDWLLLSINLVDWLFLSMCWHFKMIVINNILKIRLFRYIYCNLRICISITIAPTSFFLTRSWFVTRYTDTCMVTFRFILTW